RRYYLRRGAACAVGGADVARAGLRRRRPGSISLAAPQLLRQATFARRAVRLAPRPVLRLLRDGRGTGRLLSSTAFCLVSISAAVGGVQSGMLAELSSNAMG